MRAKYSNDNYRGEGRQAPPPPAKGGKKVEDDDFDMSKYSRLTTERLGIVTVDMSKPVFQDNNVEYSFEFDFYMKIKDKTPLTLNECEVILYNIINTFEFDTHAQETPSGTTFYYRLGKLMMRWDVDYNRARGLSEFEVKKFEIEKFKNLIKSHIDLVGDKPNIKKSKPKQITPETKPWNGLDFYGVGRTKVPDPRLTMETLIPSPSIIGDIIDEVIEEAKKIRKYDLDSMDITDDVYKEVVKYIESLKDYIAIDYEEIDEE